MLKNEWLNESWNGIRLDPVQPLPEKWGAGVNRRFKAICSCNRGFSPVFNNLSSGKTKSCGKCKFKPTTYWLAQEWGKLRLDPSQPLPEEWGPGFHQKLKVICQCGRSITPFFGALTSGNTNSCGRCRWKEKAWWLAQKWGKLKLDPNQELPDEWGGGLDSREMFFFCDCGRKTSLTIQNAVNGRVTSCTKCEYKLMDYWLSRKWGELRLDPDQTFPEEWGKGNHAEFSFLHDSGATLKIKFCDVTYGKVDASRKHGWMPKEHWLAKRWGKLMLDPNQELPDKWGRGHDSKLVFLCDCKNRPSMAFYSVAGGKVQSCGCAKPGFSDVSPAREIYDFVIGLAADAEFSHWFRNEHGEKREYDIYVPSKKLAIEYHGLYWHTEEKTGRGDWSKFKNRGNIRLLQVYQDEWSRKKEIIKAQIQELLSVAPKLRVNPIFEAIPSKTPSEARSFLDSHHYLGAAGGCLTILARHPKSKEIIGVWVFMKREAGTVLWHRACWDHRYKAWNPHEKALRMAMPILKGTGFRRMITFADNRFHTGEMYEKIGFRFEKEIPPDYYYTDGKVRKSKYALRVKAGVDEVDNAAAMGWHRIWDSGKKRFSLPLV